MLRFFCIAAFFLSCLCAGCDDPVYQSRHPHSSNLDIYFPAQVPLGGRLPFGVFDGSNPRPDSRYRLDIVSDGLDAAAIIMKRGQGSALAIVDASSEIEVSLFSEVSEAAPDITVQVDDLSDARILSGPLSGTDLIWDSTAAIKISSNVTVAAGDTLHIASGTLVVMGSLARLDIYGVVLADGDGSPIYFTAESFHQPWGEITHHSGSHGIYSGVFFTGGGGDVSQAFGHSNSQPVVRGTECELEFDHVFLLDNPGKGLGTIDCNVVFIHSMISRCDMGMELHSSPASIAYSAFMDIPDGDRILNDDDNDMLHFNSLTDDTIYIDHCVFVRGEDDAIDQDNANVTVQNCVFDDAEHEGIAASADQHVAVENCLILNCGQGIEAGFGSPQVVVNHCTVIGNRNGVRWGDEYDWADSDGTVTMTNSISVDNAEENILNFDPQQGAGENRIVVAYSIVNEQGYNNGTGCLTGSPQFEGDYTLDEGSVGRAAASDGEDMGILPYGED